jgi:hypothetical protein
LVVLFELLLLLAAVLLLHSLLLSTDERPFAERCRRVIKEEQPRGGTFQCTSILRAYLTHCLPAARLPVQFRDVP